MGSFSYGKASGPAPGSGFHHYYFLEPYQGPGYYPMDGFESMSVFDDETRARHSEQAGTAVYGVMSYLRPLSQEQLDNYNMAEAAQYGKEAPDPEKPAEPDHTWLHKVPARFVYDTKNPGYGVLSIKMDQSESGYGNVVLNKSCFVEERDGNGVPTGNYSVDLGPSNYWRNVSVRKGNGYERIPVDVTELRSLFQAQQESYQTVAAQEKAQGSKRDSSCAYLNYVDKKFLYDTKNPDYKIVSVPFPESENGFAKVTVPARNIFQTMDVRNQTPVPGKVNVNLGDRAEKIGFSVRKDGSFVNQYMEAGAFADGFRQRRQQYVQKHKDAVLESGEQAGPEVSADFPFQEDDAVFE